MELQKRVDNSSCPIEDVSVTDTGGIATYLARNSTLVAYTDFSAHLLKRIRWLRVHKPGKRLFTRTHTRTHKHVHMTAHHSNFFSGHKRHDGHESTGGPHLLRVVSSVS